MKGITVDLYERTAGEPDAFNRPTYTETKVEVQNVLVSPEQTGGEELLDALDLTGRKAVYTLAIPKGDTHTWEGNRVDFFGESWKVIGIPTKGIDDLIPLQWNMKVRVERIE